MTAGGDTDADVVRLGRIAGAHGIKGWVKVRSNTEPGEAILDYQPWLIGPELKETEVRQGSTHGAWILAELEGVTDRDAAEALAGHDIAARRSQLPALPADRFYWTDIVGSTVVTTEGVNLGTLVDLMETGAHDVMRVRGDRERLIPFVVDRYVRSVDLDAKRIEVDWDPEF